MPASGAPCARRWWVGRSTGRPRGSARQATKEAPQRGPAIAPGIGVGIGENPSEEGYWGVCLNFQSPFRIIASGGWALRADVAKARLWCGPWCVREGTGGTNLVSQKFMRYIAKSNRGSFGSVWPERWPNCAQDDSAMMMGGLEKGHSYGESEVRGIRCKEQPRIFRLRLA